MGEINQIIAGPIPLVVGEKTYNLSQLTDKIRAEFERHLETEALALVQRHKEEYGDDYLDVLRGTNQDILSGVYSFGSPAFINSMRTVSGACFMLYLLLKGNQKITLAEVRTLFMEHGSEIAQGINTALGLVETKEDNSKKNLTDTQTAASITS